MIGAPIGGTGLGGAFPFDDIRPATASISLALTLSVQSEASARQITDTTDIRMPVNVYLAESSVRKNVRLGRTQDMTRPMMKKIFGE